MDVSNTGGEDNTASEDNTGSEEWKWEWDKEKTAVYKAAIREFKKDFEEFERDFDEASERILPALARHFDGKALTDLKRANPWLAIFEPDSKLPWKEAKDAFLVDGPAVLDTLTSLTELIRSESGIGIILSIDINMSTQLLLAIRQELERDRHSYTVEDRVLELSTGLTKNTLDAGEESGIAKDRIETLLKTGLEVDIDNAWYTKMGTISWAR